MSNGNQNTARQTAIRSPLWFLVFPVLAILATLLPQSLRGHIGSESVTIALFAFTISATLIFCLSWRLGSRKLVLAASIGAGILFALLAYFAAQRFSPDKTPAAAFSILFVGQILFVTLCLLPFLQSRLETNVWSWKNERIFIYAWDNSLALALGTVLTILFFISFAIASKLLELLGNNFIEGAFHETEPMFLVLSGMTGFAIALARIAKPIVSFLRGTAVFIARLLAPVLVIVALVLLFLLYMVGIEGLAENFDLSSTLVTVAVLGLFVTNAMVFGGAEIRNNYSVARYSVFILQPLLLGIAAVACYAVYLRIAQYGITPRRFVLSFAAALISCHFLGCFLSFLFRSRWVEACRRGRAVVTLAATAFVVLTLTPLADPFLLSAESQYRQLAEGKADPETFSYRYLEWRLGDAGHQALARLRVDSGAAASSTVNRKIDELQREYPFERAENIAFASQEIVDTDVLNDPSRIILIPPTLELPSSFHGKLLGPFVSKASCVLDDGPGCLITALELTDGAGLEYLIAVRRPDAPTEIWLMERHAPMVRHARLLRPDSTLELWDALVSGDIAAVPANHFDLRIGEDIIRLRDLP